MAIREILAPITGHVGDFERWVRLGVYMQNLGDPYTGLKYYPGVSFAPQHLLGSISYPPLSAFIFALTYRLYILLGEPSRYLYYFLLKQPMVLSDLGAAVLLARIILLSKSPASARIGFLIWLYFPLGILVSSVWGALDPPSLFLTLLAIYYFFSSRRTSSAVALGLAIFLKTIPVIALPVFLLKLAPGSRQRLGYAGVSLAIPALGTVTPIFLLDWGFRGIVQNFSYQVDNTGSGAFGVIGSLFQFYQLHGIAHTITGLLWIPATILSYLYIYKRNLSLTQSLLIAFLAFSVTRVFLPEQWTLYPAALLITMIDQKQMTHFLGLTLTATIFLVINNTWLIPFLTPISVSFYYYSPFGNAFPYSLATNAALLALSCLYLVEALMTISGRESVVYRALIKVSTDLHMELPYRVRTLLST